MFNGQTAQGVQPADILSRQMNLLGSSLVKSVVADYMASFIGHIQPILS